MAIDEVLVASLLADHVAAWTFELDDVAETLAERDRLRERGNEVAVVAGELARWSSVASENGDLHARLASALALWEEAGSSAAGQPVGERQGRQPASSHNRGPREATDGNS